MAAIAVLTLGGCQSYGPDDGGINTSVSLQPTAVPVAGPVYTLKHQFESTAVNTVGGLIDTITEGAAELLGLDPIPDVISGGQPNIVLTPTSPEDRMALRRWRMGLPENAEMRVARRRAERRAWLLQQTMPNGITANTGQPATPLPGPVLGTVNSPGAAASTSSTSTNTAVPATSGSTGAGTLGGGN